MGVYLFTKLFYLLLFSLMFGTLCGRVCANAVEGGLNAENTIELFKEETISDVLQPELQQAQVITVKDYYSPFLLSTNDFFVALAGIYRTNTDQKNITVLTKYFDTNKEDWKEKVIVDFAEWKAKFAVYDNCQGDSCNGKPVVKGLVAAAKDSNIYLLLVNVSSTENNVSPGGPTFEFNLVEGIVNTSNNNKVTWDKKRPLTFSENPEFINYLKKQKLGNGALAGSALVKDENFIFLLRTQTNDKESAFAFIDLKNTEGENKLQFLSSNDVDQNCYPYFFLWESKIIVIPTQCAEGVSNQKIKEITDVTKTGNWIKNSEQFSYFVNFFNDKSDFTTATIQKNTNINSVLLFTQKKNENKEPPNKDNSDLYLWATDGKRFYNAGTFLTNVNVTSINLLYTKEELLVLYQQWKNNQPENIFLKRLKKQLDDITTVIEAWKTTDETVKKLCSGKISCAPPLSTAGLVGFLSDNNQSTTWKDEYYYVNATIKSKQNGNNNKAEKITDGFKFIGEGVGAQWSVGKERKEDQPYDFTDPGFTLLATVEIEKNSNDKTFDNSLLGLILKEDDNKRIGLLCSGGNWAVGDKTHIFNKSREHKCEQEETYIVGLVLEKNKPLAIFVDGKKLDDLDHEELKIGLSQNIAHFYFGADAEGAGDAQQLAKTDVTITNVLLYNRPFKEDEIKNIKARKREKPKIPPPPINGTISTQEDGKNTGETDSASSTSATPTATEKDGAEIKLCSPLKNDFTVFALLLLVGFTLLARYV